jgi:DNA repair protein RadC
MSHHCRLLEKPLSDAFLADDQGFYRAHRPISANEIIQAAKTLLSQRVQRIGSLVDYQEIKDFLMAQLSGNYEILAAVFLDASFQVIEFERLFSSEIDSLCPIVPQYTAKRALELNAKKVILAHNALSSQSRPVQADKEIAKRVQVLLATLEIELFDYCVISGSQVTSLTEWGFLKKPQFHH